jgi:hypothetical protein
MTSNRAQPLRDDTAAEVTVAPAFMLLFSIRLTKPFTGFGMPPAGIVPLPPEQQRAYLDQFVDFEGRLLGETFLETHRITRWPLGRVPLTGAADGEPPYADVGLLMHKSGVALWEAWLPASEQAFDVTRWIAWLDPDAEDGLIAHLWQTLGPINREITGSVTWSGLYFPVALLRAPHHPLDAIVSRHGTDLVRLLFLDHSPWRLRAEVVQEELAGNYCAREGGMTLLARRCAVDVHAHERLIDEKSVPGLPPRAALPLIVTMEMLLIEHSTLQQIYQRLSGRGPGSVEELLALKQQVLDALEEYYGAITTATRFSEAVTAEGERLFGIVDLYEALTSRLDAVSFEITTRYQKRMTTLQFWLTIVFGATEIGFVASGIATWYYRLELSLVLAWTVGTTIVAALILASLLRGKLD